MRGAFYPSQFFPPAARVDEHIAIVRGPEEPRIYGRVTYVEPIPVYSVADVIPAGAALYNRELQYVEAGANEVLQLRFAVRGAARIRVRLPSSVRRFMMLRESGWIDETIAQYPRFPPQTELHILEYATHVYYDAENLNQTHPEKVKVYVTGWRIVFEPVQERPESYAALIVSGFAPRSRA